MTKARRLEATMQSPTRVQSALCTWNSLKSKTVNGGALQLMTNSPALSHRVAGDVICESAAREVFNLLKSFSSLF